jgi:hypothetical protein
MMSIRLLVGIFAVYASCCDAFCPAPSAFTRLKGSANLQISRARSSKLGSLVPRPLRAQMQSSDTPLGFPSFLPNEISEVEDQACIDMARRLRMLPVADIPSTVASDAIMTSCVGPEEGQDISDSPYKHPFVLLHGFDSSCLEWRRLVPLMEGRMLNAHLPSFSLPVVRIDCF